MAGVGGAMNVGVKQKTLDKFRKVQELLRQQEPKVTLTDALKRYSLPVSTYYRLRAKYESEAEKTA